MRAESTIKKIGDRLGIIIPRSAIMNADLRARMPTLESLIDMAKQSGVIFHACSPTMKLSGITKDDLIPQCNDIIGAATFIDLAADNATTIFI